MIALALVLACDQAVTPLAPPPGLSVGAALFSVAPDTGDVLDSGPVDPDAPLALCVNEFMPDNKAALVLDDDSSPDWIELHNPGAEAVSLAGWSVSDDTDEPDKHTLDDSLVVGPRSFLLLLADNAPELGPTHLPFKLAASEGSVGIYDPSGKGEVIHHGQVEPDFSVIRRVDCCPSSDCLDFDFRGTPGSTNGS